MGDYYDPQVEERNIDLSASAEHVIKALQERLAAEEREKRFAWEESNRAYDAVRKAEASFETMRKAVEMLAPQKPYPVTRYHKYAGRQVAIRVTCPTCKTTINLKEVGLARDPDPAIADLSWHEPGCLYVYAASILGDNPEAIVE